MTSAGRPSFFVETRNEAFVEGILLYTDAKRARIRGATAVESPVVAFFVLTAVVYISYHLKSTVGHLQEYIAHLDLRPEYVVEARHTYGTRQLMM